MTAAPEHARADAGARVPEASLVAAGAAESKQGEETAVLAMSGTLGVTDAFVVTSGRNPRQVRTIVDEVERQVARHLVAHQDAELAAQFAERLGRAVLVAQERELVLDQGMVDDGEVWESRHRAGAR